MKFFDALYDNGSDPKVGFAIALMIGYCLYKYMTIIEKRRHSKDSENINDNMNVSNSDNYKLVLVIRTDLKMGKGKVAAQCAHAAVAAYKAAAKHRTLLRAWEKNGQAKITLKVNDEKTLLEISKHARNMGIFSNIVRDAGRTQVAPETKTVCAIGPGPVELIDEITGHLSLY